ncbi:MAG TPA: hypothetical protein VH372_20815 [Actinospica sp.]|nr:hypothetical protein [Actinospica sp.]
MSRPAGLSAADRLGLRRAVVVLARKSLISGRRERRAAAPTAIGGCGWQADHRFDAAAGVRMELTVAARSVSVRAADVIDRAPADASSPAAAESRAMAVNLLFMRLFLRIRGIEPSPDQASNGFRGGTVAVGEPVATPYSAAASHGDADGASLASRVRPKGRCRFGAAPESSP